ncbi:MAG: hypothetical protein JNK15_22575 [Planctomycetes bacterium]|nr:hypothetical protein [Planctomycetota bacterium]
MTRWSELLTKTHVDIGAIEVPDGLTPEESYCIKDLLFFADVGCPNVEQLTKVRERLKKALARGPKTKAVRAVAKAIDAELDEIERDLEFARSRRGKFILFSNDWAQSFHAERKADRGLDGVALGAHGELERIVAAGTVDSPDALVRLVHLLAAHPPGVPIEYRVVVADGGGVAPDARRHDRPEA